MKIDHLAIWVKDLEQMRAFYEKYFETHSNELYHNTKKDFKSYFLAFDGACRLELMQMSSITENKNDAMEQYIGIIHFAVSVGSAERVDHLTKVLKKDGYKVIGEPRTTGDGYYESVVLDPEGNRIEITI